MNDLLKPFDEKMTRLTSMLSKSLSESHRIEDEIREMLKGVGYEI